MYESSVVCLISLRVNWSSLIGQESIAALLQRAIVSQRLPHALLLSGREGVGKSALAIQLARVTNCQSPTLTNATIEACGQCQSCTQMRSLQHPNLRFVTSLPAGSADTEADMKSDLIEDLQQALAAKSSNLYHQMRIEGATQIRIGQIRELKRSLALSASQGGRRVVVICEAHEMTSEASNAFLKTLEEPHANVSIVLTSSRPERLLPTIISRCQHLTCPPIDDDVLVSFLIDKGHCSADEARLVTPFADGSVTRALAFLGEDVQGNRADVVELLRTALRGKDFRADLVDRIRAITDGRNKPRMELMLSLLAVWLRDAKALAVVGPEASIQNADQREALTRFAATFGHADMSHVLTEIERAVGALHRNVTPVLVFLRLMLSVRRSLFLARVKAVAP
jgi:DNA polymerase-3 subunit delta'